MIDKAMAPSRDAQMSVQYLKGVGPKMAEKLAKLGARTVEDLLCCFPRTWEDRKQFCPLKDARLGEEMTFRGKIKLVQFLETRRGFAIVQAVIDDGTGELSCKWMRKKSFRYDVLQPFRKELKEGATILVHGMIERDFAGTCMMVNEHEIFAGAEDDLVHIDRIVPVYPLTEGLRQRFVRKLIHDVLPFASAAADPLPATVAQNAGLMPQAEALRRIHFPDSFDDLKQARHRLAFQELFMVQMVLAIARRKRKVLKGRRYEVKKHLLTPFREKCGFEFTAPQKRAIREIFEDLGSQAPMNRLLQGDVGSGKTVVAISAMLLACENGFQAALMAPTEILAEQHFITLKHLLQSLPVRIGLLTGSVKGKERKQFLKDCAEGAIGVAVGTHALLEEDVKFRKLALAVIDEQHRFGVRHRLSITLPEKTGSPSDAPDVLILTATPIPRTLAMGLYGDLDVSVIEGLPPGRQKISTVCKSEGEAWAMIREQVSLGHQAYVVYPLVDESDKVELKAAIQEFERLQDDVFRGVSMGLLHGQMSGKEKEKVMNEFHAGRFAVLVATTVIEVGIDVPNATVMVIQDAERFGLSTLHQLRGRVGRGSALSHCVLVARPKSGDAVRRIEVLLQTSNGFELAEKDLEIRGPGEIFGTSQHGLPPFKIADLVRDAALVAESQKAAREWLERDPDLARPESSALKAHLVRHFSKNWHWANIA